MNTIRRTVMIIAASCLLYGVAHGHTQLSSSIPADAAALESAPSEIVLTFSDAVRLTAITIAGNDDDRPLDIAITDPSEEFTVGLPSLSPGNYIVSWRALSQDTHVVSGEIRFSVAD